MRHIFNKYTLNSLRKRVLALIVIIALLFCLLFARLAYVSTVKGGELSIKATDQWTRELSLAAERGKIYDTNGATIAVSYTTYDIYVRGREVEDAEKLAQVLSSALGVDYEQTLSKCQNKSTSESLIKLSVDETKAKELQLNCFSGLYFSENVKRYYPYGSLLAQVLGFTTIDSVGQAGLEAYFNEYLSGKDGEYLVQSDLIGNTLENSLEYYISAIDGLNITTTIDVNMQLIVEDVLADIIEEQKAKSASCIIMDCETGEILSMAIAPTFDLNNIPRDNVSALMEIVKNQLIVDVYEPGSTFKILTISSALEEGLTNLDDTFYCPGYRMVDGQKIKCWKTIGHGSETLLDGFVNSCNCVFMDLAQRLGTEKFYEYLSAFGIGSKTGIEISGESSGLLISEDQVKNCDLARIGFGQSVAVNALQLLSAFVSCVNGGELLKPYLVKDITMSSGETVVSNTKTVVNNVISQETSAIINQLLLAQTTKNGKTTFVAGYDIGGKTGTAQKYENGAIAQGKYVASFFGTYPANDPKYAVLLIVDEPSNGAYYGSVVAAPYAKTIFSGLFDYLGIAPSSSLSENSDMLIANIEMPYLVGMSLTEAILTLNSLNITYEIDGEGEFVEWQYPPEGTLLYKYQTVIIKTNNST